LGLSSDQTGSILEIIGFIVFAPLILIINLMLSFRVYKIHRQLAVTVLSLGVFLLVLTVIIGNALLALR
jgi:hypothetical protein